MKDTVNQEKLKDLLEEAEVAALREKYVTAYRKYEKLLADADDMGYKRYAVTYMTKAKRGLEKTLDPPNKLLDEAEKLIKKGKADEAAEKMKEVEAKHAGLLHISKPLLKRYKALGGKPAFAEEAREKSARSRMLRGDAAMARKDYTTAYKYYTPTATSYADTLAGKESTQKLAKLLADPDVRKAVKEKEAAGQCRLLLARANALMNARRYAEARAACEKVLLYFPDTEWALKAVEQLDLIKKMEKPAAEK